MSHETCETVRIKSPQSPDGFKVINKEDFDPAEHKLFGEVEAPQKEDPPEDPPEGTVELSNKGLREEALNAMTRDDLKSLMDASEPCIAYKANDSKTDLIAAILAVEFTG